MIGLAATTHEAKSRPAEGIRIDFDEPGEVRAIEVSCFGVDTMQVSIEITTESEAVGAESSVTCGEMPTAVMEPVADDLVSAVRINGYNEDGFGAWAAVIE